MRLHVSAGNLNSQIPIMDFMFEVNIARAIESAGTGMGPVLSWVIDVSPIRCDIAPLKDEMYFLQAGQQNVATHVLHFFSGTNVLERHRIKIISNRRLAGAVGSWYEITQRFEPTETLSYVRCFAKISDVPS